MFSNDTFAANSLALSPTERIKKSTQRAAAHDDFQNDEETMVYHLDTQPDFSLL